MLCHVMSCYVKLCNVMSCYDMSCYVMSCHVMLCYACSVSLRRFRVDKAFVVVEDF